MSTSPSGTASAASSSATASRSSSAAATRSLLTRYFPEVVESLLANLPERCVLDGEIVIVGEAGLDFDCLLQRIHPAASRIKLLASSTPASFVAFDLLALGGEDLRQEPFVRRRNRLEGTLQHAAPPVYVTPATSDPVVARDWFSRFEGGGLDGVVAKPGSLAYLEGERVMLKVKHERTADCVVGGFRWHKDGGGVGSLLLGLYDGEGALHHVGVASGFSVALRKSLVEDLAPHRVEDLEGHPWKAMAPEAGSTRRPGAPSRWNAARTFPGRPCAPSSSARSPTTTCRATGSATRPPFAGGVPIETCNRAPMPS